MQLTRRRFISGAVGLAAFAGLGAKPRERKKTMGFQFTGAQTAMAPANGTPAVYGSAVHTVPDGTYWEISGFYAVAANSANAGVRNWSLNLVNPSALIIHSILFPTAAASVATLQNRIVSNPSVDSSTVIIGGTNLMVRVAFQPLIAPASHTIRLQDLAGIDVAGDLVLLSLAYKEYRYVNDAAAVTIVQPLSVPQPFA